MNTVAAILKHKGNQVTTVEPTATIVHLGTGAKSDGAAGSTIGDIHAKRRFQARTRRRCCVGHQGRMTGR
jgi:hypothetical protein